MKKLLALLLVLILGLTTLVGCGSDDDEIYISVISKGFQHQFWQTVYAGAQSAAEYYDVSIFFDGPESEADIAVQVNMLNNELAKAPDAIALAALSTHAVMSQLQEAQNRGIPIIGFDSGVPDAPAGSVYANASTDNQAAAALGADNLFPVIQGQIAAATSADPVVIAVLSQDVTSESITGRTRGFAERMFQLASGVNGSVAITGGFGAINTGSADAAVIINVVVAASADITDMTSSAHGIFTTPGLAGVFASNEGAANAIIATINAGTVVPDGAHIVGFDAGAGQKAAVAAGIFLGAITQDPYQIGYQAVSLAVRAIRGESVSDIDTGARWWDASNMNDPVIAILLYD